MLNFIFVCNYVCLFLCPWPHHLNIFLSTGCLAFLTFRLFRAASIPIICCIYILYDKKIPKTLTRSLVLWNYSILQVLCFMEPKHIVLDFSLFNFNAEMAPNTSIVWRYDSRESDVFCFKVSFNTSKLGFWEIRLFLQKNWHEKFLGNK